MVPVVGTGEDGRVRAARFGVLLDPQYAPEDDLRARIGELIDTAQAARDLAFDSVHTIHHYLAGLQTLQPFPLLARLIDHTGDMGIGTNILILPLLHPVQVAEDVATLDQLSGGRVILGVGTGYREQEFAAFGVEHKRRVSRFTESVELLTRLWSGESVSFEGKHFSLENARISLLPAARPHPPIWVGANAEPGIRRAARLGCSWLASANTKRRWAQGHLAIHREELAKAGHGTQGMDFPIHRDLCIADSREEAFALAEEYVRRSYLSYSGYGLEYFESMFDDIKNKAFFFGTPEEVADKIADFHAAGFDHFIFRTGWLGSPASLGLRTMERFSSEVRPLLEARGVPTVR